MPKTTVYPHIIQIISSIDGKTKNKKIDRLPPKRGEVLLIIFKNAVIFHFKKSIRKYNT